MASVNASFIYCLYYIWTVAYAEFWKGGGQKLQKIWEEHRSEFEIVSLKFRPIFRPKSDEEQKKGLHSNFVPFSPNIRWFRAQKLMPNLQRGGEGMPQFCSLFYAILQSWRPKGGGHGPPLNTPLRINNYFNGRGCCCVTYRHKRRNCYLSPNLNPKPNPNSNSNININPNSKSNPNTNDNLKNKKE